MRPPSTSAEPVGSQRRLQGFVLGLIGPASLPDIQLHGWDPWSDNAAEQPSVVRTTKTVATGLATCLQAGLLVARLHVAAAAATASLAASCVLALQLPASAHKTRQLFNEHCLPGNPAASSGARTSDVRPGLDNPHRAVMALLAVAGPADNEEVTSWREKKQAQGVAHVCVHVNLALQGAVTSTCCIPCATPRARLQSCGAVQVACMQRLQIFLQQPNKYLARNPQHERFLSTASDKHNLGILVCFIMVEVLRSPLQVPMPVVCAYGCCRHKPQHVQHQPAITMPCT